SLCYPTPEYRPCVDVDIWLYGEQHRGDAVVREVLGAKVEDDRHHHTVFYVDGVMIENHFDFLNIHSHLSNRDLERELLRCTEEQSEVVDVDGAKVFLPPLNMHALFLVRHAAAHFAAVEIVLRHIVDWAMFLSRYHNDIDWQWLYSICREHKMDKFLDALNLLAVEVCGIDEAYIPVVTRRRDIEQRILRDILSPEFSERQPEGGVVRVVWYKWRRWWANRWKHQLVYRDSLATTLLTQVRSHLLKPTTIRR
ncbi:MAG: nucleotidyltransferase family protein, partial [Alistipes sp.]|nr:nucleotidyltransferase family protein [Alistipes sp.]